MWHIWQYSDNADTIMRSWSENEYYMIVDRGIIYHIKLKLATVSRNVARR